MPKQTKRSRRILKILLIAGAALLVAGAVWYGTQPKKQDGKKVASTQAVSAKEATDANKLAKPTDTKNASGDATTSAATSTSNMTLIVSRPVNGDKLPLSEGIQMRVMVTNSSSKTGTCNLTATGPSGQKVSKSADFTSQPSYSSCAIDIPGSQLVAGEWSLSLTATSGGTTTKPMVTKVVMQ